MDSNWVRWAVTGKGKATSCPLLRLFPLPAVPGPLTVKDLSPEVTLRRKSSLTSLFGQSPIIASGPLIALYLTLVCVTDYSLPPLPDCTLQKGRISTIFVHHCYPNT